MMDTNTEGCRFLLMTGNEKRPQTTGFAGDYFSRGHKTPVELFLRFCVPKHGFER
jgi:hypothetical protein